MVPTGGVRTLIVIKPRATPTEGEPRKGAHRETCTVLMGYSKGSALWLAPSSLCWWVPCTVWVEVRREWVATASRWAQLPGPATTAPQFPSGSIAASARVDVTAHRPTHTHAGP